MAWILLVVAGLFEMVGITFLNAYVNSGKFRALIGLVGFFSMSFWALSIAMLVLPMSTAYAVWTGIGAVGGALVGMIFYKESKDIKRVICILVILGSTVGLKLVS
ncbi:DMT family transporter [Staphylococcus pseudoxylosus]|uniref:DMT family transporter n=1 Tax=Staphylococcus pseudoxylosus TaxID=2282419 RepID=UPI002DBE3C5A|nr:multidrug efflux SMR transporter [Staphylococcus pseudoxylosus]MEB6044622.1 multidrug efflux SMR transporter [Staphylococcus pseudoxylosus]MEB8008975.1 multidrug efflux SMR transporter [Staphylococcus pseudoxylosus]